MILVPCPWAVGRCALDWLTRSLPRTCPTRPRSSPRPVRAPPAWSATPSSSPSRGAPCTSDASWPRLGCATSWWSTDSRLRGRARAHPRSVRRRPPGLEQDLLEQDDLQVVPGVLGVQVFANGEFVPVTAGRGTPLPSTTEWSYPSAADVAGWQPLFASLSGGAPAPATVSSGTLYAGYAPAGRFTVTSAGRSAVRQPAFGWAAQYQVSRGNGHPAALAVPARPARRPARGAGLGGPPARAPRSVPAGHDPAARTRSTPAHQSREHRWRMLVLVVVVVAGVGVAAGRGETQCRSVRWSRRPRW